MAAELYYARQGANSDSRTLLAGSAPIDLTLDSQKSTPFALTLTPTPDADYIPYEGPADLILHIQLASASTTSPFGPTPIQARINTADFAMKLPLNEYHDRLTGEAESKSGIEILAQGVVEKAALPGSLVTYAFDVRNTGSGTDAFIIDAAGNDAGRASLVPNGVVNLAGGEMKRVTLGVNVPVDANDGTQLEVLLFVHAQNDPSKMAIARTKTTVTKQASQAVPDETNVLLAAQAQQKKSPGAGVLILSVGAAAAALLMSRRRR
jgi:hypothetical protein